VPLPEFIEQLRDLDYEVEVAQENFAVFDYDIELGPRAGATVKLALNGSAFPMAPPGGILVSPPLLPEHPGGEPPSGGINPASVGGFQDPTGKWQYWSRPFQGWTAGMTAADYMCFVRALFRALSE
jgi:hypothetical protein